MDFPHTVARSDCYTKRYHANNGVVLIHGRPGDHRSEVIVFLDAADLGFNKCDQGPEVLARAEPIFKAILDAHNRGFEHGRTVGDQGRLRTIKEALAL